MSEQGTTKDVSLSLLKSAIERYVSSKERDLSLTIRASELAHTWRLAFEWREGLRIRWALKVDDKTPASVIEALHAEGDEGMRLIREHLQ